jgi:hypothetical protein
VERLTFTPGPGALCLLSISVCLLLAAEVAAASYEEDRAQAVKRCEAISPSDHQSGLLFNPDGLRSYYVRSQCLQEVAVRFRDAALCAQVRERRSLLWSSWGYSPSRCRTLVTEGTATDRRELEKMKADYAAGGVKLRDFEILRNGNGRDTDILPAFEGSFGTGYLLIFEILRVDGPPALVYRSGHYVDGNSNMRLYVPQTDIRARFPGFMQNRNYTVRGTVTFDPGRGGMSAVWSDAFIESVFPARERSHSITRRAVF